MSSSVISVFFLAIHLAYTTWSSDWEYFSYPSMLHVPNTATSSSAALMRSLNFHFSHGDLWCLQPDLLLTFYSILFLNGSCMHLTRISQNWEASRTGQVPIRSSTGAWFHGDSISYLLLHSASCSMYASVTARNIPKPAARSSANTPTDFLADWSICSQSSLS